MIPLAREGGGLDAVSLAHGRGVRLHRQASRHHADPDRPDGLLLALVALGGEVFSLLAVPVVDTSEPSISPQ